jgi:D-glycero-beta-D-manno-heptose-7-phosphate kinase
VEDNVHLIIRHSSFIISMSETEETLKENLGALIGEFARRRVLVVGDLVADQFVLGEISRVSREAPVMILRHELTETVPGGAANCAMNLAALGARTRLVGVVGDDETGGALLQKLTDAGVDCTGVVVTPKLRTTTKVRFLAGHAHSPRQQVIRLDYESEPLRDADVIEEIVRNVRTRFVETDAGIVSDYNYGVASLATVEALRTLSAQQKKPVLVDSRFRLTEFSGFTSATPNEDEVEHVGFDALLVTRGKHGVMLFERGVEAVQIPAVGEHDAVDVTGAGDTVIATYALALASGSRFADAARLANHAGGLVVLKRGTATITQQELLDSVREN